MNEIKISIIAAIGGSEVGLKNTLDSIKAQSFRDFEVIMLNVGELPKIEQVMKEYLSDRRFSYRALESNSISEARNLGISLSRGKYIAFAQTNVVFSEDFLISLYRCAKESRADLCIAPMSSSDLYGKHEFSSTWLLSKRKHANKFDTDIIWNPSVTNKLFLKSTIEKQAHSFNRFGKARDAAFTIPFAFKCDTIVSSTKGTASYVVPVINEGVSAFPIEHYLKGYEYIVLQARQAFSKEKDLCVTDFDRKELEKLEITYIDQIYRKQITVLLYSYYRHFWLLSDEKIEKYAGIIMGLIDCLSPGGRVELLKKNKDIFYKGRLITSKGEMAQRPKLTLCIIMGEKTAEYIPSRLDIQLSSIYMQTMPCFELLIDKRLEAMLPEKWKGFENIRYIEGESSGECKNRALSESRTDYIMLQDGLARLNPKLLMRHYLCLAGKDKYGFSVSPVSRFDGERVSEYSFTELSFYKGINDSRANKEQQSFALDLFFCNKLFRVEHLKGIKFSFSDNPVADMYRLYTHSRFKKLSSPGAYLPFSEQQAVDYLLSEGKRLPAECTRLYKGYKKRIFKAVTLKKAKGKVSGFLAHIIRVLTGLISRSLTAIYTGQRLKSRVFFFSSLPDGAVSENMKVLYERCSYSKELFDKPMPHNRRDMAKIRKYMLTSKVIVLDGKLEYLRGLKLRKGQRVIQLWHKNGAFRRFGLDSKEISSYYREYKCHSQYTDVCVSSEYVRQFYAHAFGVDMETVKATGTPSSDIRLDKGFNEANAEIIRNKHPLLRDKKVYVYFPTYRKSEGELANLEPGIDWARLNRELADDEIFVVSRHPVMKEEFFAGTFYSRVKDYTVDPTGELLALADVILTDYSSVIFDGALLGKPMVFYCSDFGEFEPDFYIDYENELPGEILKDSSELLQALRRAHQVSTPERISAFREKFMGSCDKHSSERILKLISDYLK